MRCLCLRQEPGSVASSAPTGSQMSHAAGDDLEPGEPVLPGQDGGRPAAAPPGPSGRDRERAGGPGSAPRSHRAPGPHPRSRAGQPPPAPPPPPAGTHPHPPHATPGPTKPLVGGSVGHIQTGPTLSFPRRLLQPGGAAGRRPGPVQVIQSDVASGDAFVTSVRRIVTHTLAQTGAGSIVVMHLTGGTPPHLPRTPCRRSWLGSTREGRAAPPLDPAGQRHRLSFWASGLPKASLHPAEWSRRTGRGRLPRRRGRTAQSGDTTGRRGRSPRVGTGSRRRQTQAGQVEDTKKAHEHGLTNRRASVGARIRGSSWRTAG
jgi:hypothetical protein